MVFGAKVVKRSRRSSAHATWFAILRVAAAVPVAAQQVADGTFDALVARPAYTTPHPRVLFDEAHRNSRENGLLGDHDITSGRDSTRRVGRVIAFTGRLLR